MIAKPPPVEERRAENVAFFQKAFIKSTEISEGRPGAQRIEERDPANAALALDMRAMGESITNIVKASGICNDTLFRLFRRHSGALEQRKIALSEDHSFLAEMYLEAQRMKVERLIDDPSKLDDICPSRLALTTAIHTDKHLALTGQASVVVEHRKGVSIEDAQKALDEMRANLAQRATGTVVDAVDVSTNQLLDDDGEEL